MPSSNLWRGILGKGCGCLRLPELQAFLRRLIDPLTAKKCLRQAPAAPEFERKWNVVESDVI